MALAWAAAAVVPAAPAQSSASELSRWLSREVIPEVQELLAEHPRFQKQQVQVQAGDTSGLSHAIVLLLSSRLQGTGGIALGTRERTGPTGLVTPGSVDDLSCTGMPGYDYLLQASVGQEESGPDRVQLRLLETYPGAQQVRSWQWQGRLSTAERRQLERKVDDTVDGSLSAPWRDQDVEAAALALSRDFACALRPQIKTRLSLQWPQDLGLPAVFADTANAARHQLGHFKELGISAEQAQYTVAISVQRFRDDIWQLWLNGSPRAEGLAPVQAVTYIRTGDGLPPRTPGPPESALEFIDVQLVDATQADKGGSRADLQVTLRLGNRAQWPIAYSFTLSGGHFENCVARPGYYRHDRYGLLEGTLEAGATELRRLVIENARHNPAPVWGTPRCAGIRDLEGFEEFASQGYKVTDYVRWDM